MANGLVVMTTHLPMRESDGAKNANNIIVERKLPLIRKNLERRKLPEQSQTATIAPPNSKPIVLTNIDILIPQQNADLTKTKPKRGRPPNEVEIRDIKHKYIKVESGSVPMNITPITQNAQLNLLKKSSESSKIDHNEILRKHNEEYRIKQSKIQALQSVQYRPAYYVGVESFYGNLIIPALPMYLLDDKYKDENATKFTYESA